MTAPTKQQRTTIDAATAIRLDPDKTEAAFIARQLVQATLPHKNPGDANEWSRTNGNLTLSIRPGRYGYPYGTIPRLLLFWITTEALRTRNPRLELGNSLAQFMREIGLNPDNGGTGAKRSDARRLREQMQRLFRAVISFDVTEGPEAWIDMQIAPKGVFWWNEKQPDQLDLFHSWIQLGQDFYDAIIAAPVPVDMRALRALKRSPLALDLYAWATYTAYSTQKADQSRFISWDLLHSQLGGEYANVDEFARKAREALRKVQTVYPSLGIDFERGGVRVLPCNPAVTIKDRKRPKPGDN